jgi:NhaA family Na+:H+ antiporter
MPDDLLAGRNTGLPIEVLTSPFVRFAKMEAASGILLLAATVAALLWANSPWEHSYHSLWDAQLPLGFGRFVLSESFHEWINDGLMAIFFFLVGLEIKREVLIGELSSLRRAAFPFIAALGGVIVPALFYLSVNLGGAGQKGWGIPMATDIAFALGVLTVLGSRVPVSLKIFVTALAIVDDIIAVLVIALVYTDQIHIFSLIAGLVGVALCFGANVLGVRIPALYTVIGIFVWVAVLKSGVHATVAGVLLAFTIPARTYVDRDLFLKRGRWLLDKFEGAKPQSFDAHTAVHSLESQCKLIESPLHRIEHSVHPWVSFLVMPIFAFANAGVRILGNVQAAVRHPISLGIVLGLFLGKPLGICFFAYMSAKLRIAQPAELSWGRIFGASWLCGIGFTMSLFVATLAFGDGPLLEMSKMGILAASLAAGTGGSIFLLRRAEPSLRTIEPQMPT